MSLESAFKDKTIMVTSAGKGIGRAIAVQLYNFGATVYAIAHTEELLISLRKECPNIKTIRVDLSDWDATRDALADVELLDGLVNNLTLNRLINKTGVNGFQPVAEVTCDKLDQILNETLKISLNVSQIVVQKLIASEKPGSVVNLTTLAGRAVIPNAASYRASKAALDELSKSMAFEWGKHNIRVNSVSLGCVWTPAFQRIMEISTGNTNPGFIAEAIKASSSVGTDPMIPMQDVVNTVLFTLSDLPSKMSGGNILLDAGLSAK